MKPTRCIPQRLVIQLSEGIAGKELSMGRKLNQKEVDEILKEFEKMLDDTDPADINDLQFDPNFFDFDEEEEEDAFPAKEDLEYPDEPPPIPKCAYCEHKNKKVVAINIRIKYWYCPDCKADLGDYKE